MVNAISNLLVAPKILVITTIITRVGKSITFPEATLLCQVSFCIIGILMMRMRARQQIDIVSIVIKHELYD